MKDDGYTIRSLMLWAKEDNIEEYKNFTKNILIIFLKITILITHTVLLKHFIVNIVMHSYVQIQKITYGIILKIIVGTEQQMEVN